MSSKRTTVKVDGRRLSLSNLGKNLYPDFTKNAPYSLRAADRPSVSTPVTRDELESCRSAGALMFSPDEVLTRADEHGNLLKPLLKDRRPLP